MKRQDFVLLFVVFSSIGAAVAFPETFTGLRDFPPYTMMALLFLSFLGLEWLGMLGSLGSMVAGLGAYLVFRQLLLPAGVFFLFDWLWPDFALAALLLSGISVGVVGPYFAVQLRGNVNLAVILVVTSSLIVPLTLPALCQWLAGARMAVPFGAMVGFLGMIIVVPAIAAQFLRRVARRGCDWLLARRQPASLVLFALCNLGVFSQYAAYFRQSPAAVWQSFLAACLIAAVLLAAGLAWARFCRGEDGLQYLIGTVIVNSILVVVLASQFFGPREPTVAALYTIPFFGMILPMRLFAAFARRQPAEQACRDGNLG